MQLKGLVLLRSLNLQCTQLGDEGLACITSMSSLRELDLGFTGITDQALAFFRVTDSQDDHAGPHGLMKLAVLNLKGTRIDGPGLANLADLANLKTIYLDSSQVSDDGLAGLEKLTALRALNLANTQISDKALVHLEPLKQLRAQPGRHVNRRRGIGGTCRTARTRDPGSDTLQALQFWARRSRETVARPALDLGCCQVSDAGMEHVAKLKSLWFLSLSFTRVTDQGLEREGFKSTQGTECRQDKDFPGGNRTAAKGVAQGAGRQLTTPAAEMQTIPLKRERESSSPSGLAAARRRFRHARHGFRGYRPAYVPPRSAVRVLLRSISKKIAQVVSGLAATIV